MRPIMVSVGLKALGSTWRRSTCDSGTPLARACVTYSSRRISMVLARDMRVSTPVSTSSSVTIGKIT
jgi:hypothetical protein